MGFSTALYSPAALAKYRGTALECGPKGTGAVCDSSINTPAIFGKRCGLLKNRMKLTILHV